MPRDREHDGFAHLVLVVLIGAIVVLFLTAVVGGRSTSDDPVAAGKAIPGVDVAAIATSTDPSIVDITAGLSGSSGSIAGSGVVLSASGTVLTNNHVIAGTSEISAQVGGTGRRYHVTVMGYDVPDDLAVLQLVGATGLRPARLGSPAGARVGDGIVVLGNSLGLGGTPRAQEGTIAAFGQRVTATDSNGQNGENLTGMIEIAASVQPGDSGGPLVDAGGRVIGMNTAASTTGSSDSSATRGFAIPIDRADAIAAQIGRGQVSPTVHIGERAILGVQIKTVKSAPSVAGVNGAVVGLVDVSSPAQTAGLRADDVITAIDHAPVTSLTSLETALFPHRPGDVIELGWTDTSGHIRTASVLLISGPPL